MHVQMLCHLGMITFNSSAKIIAVIRLFINFLHDSVTPSDGVTRCGQYFPHLPSDATVMDERRKMVLLVNLLPIWALLPLGRDVFHLNVKCTCTSTCTLCKCMQSKIEVYPSIYFSEVSLGF